jgi:hypothetical protein
VEVEEGEPIASAPEGQTFVEVTSWSETGGYLTVVESTETALAVASATRSALGEGEVVSWVVSHTRTLSLFSYLTYSRIYIAVMSVTASKMSIALQNRETPYEAPASARLIIGAATGGAALLAVLAGAFVFVFRSMRSADIAEYSVGHEASHPIEKKGHEMWEEDDDPARLATISFGEVSTVMQDTLVDFTNVGDFDDPDGGLWV